MNVAASLLASTTVGLAAGAVRADPPAQPRPSTVRDTITARNLADRGLCDAVHVVAERVRAADPGYYVDVFTHDTQIARCLPEPAHHLAPLVAEPPPRAADEVTPLAETPPAETPPAETPTVRITPQLVPTVDCGQGLYLEPSLLVGSSWRGDRLVELRNAGGLELHNCDSHGHWTRAYRFGLTATVGGATAAGAQSTVGGEAEIEFVRPDHHRLGMRLGYDSGDETRTVTAGGRYHIDNVALGVDLIVFTQGYDAIPKGALGSITLGGTPGRDAVAIEAGLTLLLFVVAAETLAGGH